MSLAVRKFSRLELPVSILGFGAGHISDSSLSEKQVTFLLNGVLDAGINLIDTARSYGLSEERIGKHLSVRRSEFILSTKIGYGIEGYTDWTAPIVSAGVNSALQKLRTNYIDIVHLHSCPFETLCQDDIIDALLRTVETGKVRIAAYSGENEALIHAVNSGQFSIIQTSVNIFDQRGIEQILPLTRRTNIGVIAKRPLGNAVWRFQEQPYNQDGEIYWQRMKEMGLDFGPDWPEIALRFSAYTSGVDCCIIGSSKIENIRKNISHVEMGPLPEETYNQIRILFQRSDNNWIGHI
jgi:aryl-alcohol dehydrogenase-like predicted oxidoreductase